MRLPLLLTCLFAFLLVACGGGGKANETVTATPNAAATSPAASTPSDDGGVTPEGETPAAPASDPFGSLESYRYQMDLTGDGATSVTIKGAVEAPDSISMDFYLSDSDTPINSIIIIGTQAWAKNAITGQWESVDIAEAESQVSGLLPKDFWGDFPVEKIISLSSDEGEETVNDVTAQHYRISDATGDTLAELTELFGGADQGGRPEKFSMDLWLAVDGEWPIKSTIGATYPAGSEITQATISWEVIDANNSDISVQPPL
ncbi:MAG TPA: hypothetical protein VM013_09560 [Dehalococcoidia bacterium]|nr:hypothetical protein [Dehalococcoidia bacterium]